eukprot:CAMPEP_0171799102 /NCGR_PEP_ID=MMETSP0991-20121206/70936_1 /TAXON_ID=483369 /ORGANISM="non described non described, Strain CCMP2098" /LENGTH=139 /DNA_ID=CAMNT_0012410461 /DNA_START=180 /DNA_END=596 /DNA_ORIENTATION=+
MSDFGDEASLRGRPSGALRGRDRHRSRAAGTEQACTRLALADGPTTVPFQSPPPFVEPNLLSAFSATALSTPAPPSNTMTSTKLPLLSLRSHTCTGGGNTLAASELGASTDARSAFLMSSRTTYRTRAGDDATVKSSPP